MIFNQRIKLNLASEDELILDSQSRMCNKLYNILLERVIEQKNSSDSYELLKGRNLRDEVVKVKREHRYFYSVHSSPLKNVGFRLKDSFDNMWKIKSGYPKFRSWSKKWFSLLYDEPNKGIKINKKKVIISLGYILDDLNKRQRLQIKARLTENIRLPSESKVKNYRIVKKYGYFYLSVCIQMPDKELRYKNDRVIAIDPNHTNFFVGIDNEGKSIEFNKLYQPKYFDYEIQKLRLKRDMCESKSNKHKARSGITYFTPSRRYLRLNKAMNKLHHKRSVQVKTSLYMIANKLVSDYDVIAIGDYVPDCKKIRPSGMNRSMINQTVLSKFRKILKHVCDRKGKKFILVDESFTTQTCFHCFDRKKKTPEIRIYFCPVCGKTYNRDINSAINIGVKVNILSGSDYDSLDLSGLSYTASYVLRNQLIEGWN